MFIAEASGNRPHALLRVQPDGHSTFIGPEGQWHAAWLPPPLAAWPFFLMPAEEDRLVLALHEHCDVISSDPDHLAIFLDGDTPTLAPAAADAVKPLHAMADAMAVTIRAVDAITGLGLLVQFDDDPDLLCVDHAAFDQLEHDEIIRLHREGALGLVYASIISQSHLPWMRKAERALWASQSSQAMSQHKHPSPGSTFLGALANAHASEQAVTFITERSS